MKIKTPTARTLALVCLCISSGFLLFCKLDQVPRIWFDEGWVLSLARNWVELGHYGHLLSGEPVPASILNTGFSAIAPIALSFRLFGIGVWQGKLAGALFATGTLAILYYLAYRLYNHSVATVVLAIVVLLPADPFIHPILMGRQALGETPGLFYLLTGYVLFLWTWRRPPWFTLIASTFWGLALQAKPQFFPFFLASLSIPLLWALINRTWRPAQLLVVGIAGTILTNRMLAWGSERLLQNYLSSTSFSNDPYAILHNLSDLLTYVVVLVPSIRINAVLSVIKYALPIAIGLGYVGWQIVIRDRNKINLDDGKELLKLMLFTFSASWFLWFILFSIDWLRYLFPGWVVGSIPAAVFMLDLWAYVKKASRASLHPNLVKLGAGIFAIVIELLIIMTLIVFYAIFFRTDNSAVQVAHFLNTQTESSALIEAYDSELFFFLNRPYHYPPDTVQRQLNQRSFLNHQVTVEYDPLVADPDYIVVGPMTRWWKIYDSVLAAQAFRPIYEAGSYTVYERVDHTNMQDTH